MLFIYWKCGCLSCLLDLLLHKVFKAWHNVLSTIIKIFIMLFRHWLITYRHSTNAFFLCITHLTTDPTSFIHTLRHLVRHGLANWNLRAIAIPFFVVILSRCWHHGCVDDILSAMSISFWPVTLFWDVQELATMPNHELNRCRFYRGVHFFSRYNMLLGWSELMLFYD